MNKQIIETLPITVNISLGWLTLMRWLQLLHFFVLMMHRMLLEKPLLLQGEWLPDYKKLFEFYLIATGFKSRSEENNWWCLHTHTIINCTSVYFTLAPCILYNTNSILRLGLGPLAIIENHPFTAGNLLLVHKYINFKCTWNVDEIGTEKITNRRCVPEWNDNLLWKINSTICFSLS